MKSNNNLDDDAIFALAVARKSDITVLLRIVEEIAKKLGVFPPESVEPLRRRFEELQREELENQLRLLETFEPGTAARLQERIDELREPHTPGQADEESDGETS